MLHVCAAQTLLVFGYINTHKPVCATIMYYNFKSSVCKHSPHVGPDQFLLLFLQAVTSLFNQIIDRKLHKVTYTTHRSTNVRSIELEALNLKYEVEALNLKY